MIRGNPAELAEVRTGSLLRLRRNWGRQLAHKRGQMEKHAEGTPYYGRAANEAANLEEWIGHVETELTKRGIARDDETDGDAASEGNTEELLL